MHACVYTDFFKWCFPPLSPGQVLYRHYQVILSTWLNCISTSTASLNCMRFIYHDIQVLSGTDVQVAILNLQTLCQPIISKSLLWYFICSLQKNLESEICLEWTDYTEVRIHTIQFNSVIIPGPDYEIWQSGAGMWSSWTEAARSHLPIPNRAK